jgi:signal peptidase
MDFVRGVIMSAKKNNNRVRKGVFYALYTILGLFAVFVVLLAAAPDFMLNTVGFRTYVAHYDQMEPGIKKNALVFVTRLDGYEFDTDELVTLQSNSDLNDNGKEDLITGYFDRTSGTGSDAYYYFRSEGSTGDWATLQQNRIVGGYAFSIPVIGLIIDFIASPFGIAVVAVNVALIGGIVYVIKQDNERKKETENQK